jgi:hypothetical protein
MLIEVDGKKQNLRWVESQMDELDIDIALQRIEPAVARIEKLKGLAFGLKNNTIAQDFISFKVDERCSRLAGLVTRQLVDTHNEREKTKRNISWLVRLGFEDCAREAYLKARANIIQKRTRQVELHPQGRWIRWLTRLRAIDNAYSRATCIYTSGKSHLSTFPSSGTLSAVSSAASRLL